MGPRKAGQRAAAPRRAAAGLRPAGVGAADRRGDDKAADPAWLRGRRRRGQRLLRSRRADLELLRRALARAESPYEDVVAAVCAQLPRLSRRELSQVLTAWESGPPREEVGLEPFAPPDYLACYRAET